MSPPPTVERIALADGYDVSRVVHGGWQFSAGHRLTGDDLSNALDVLAESASLGVTTFDCADIYTGVEELYGRFRARWTGRPGATDLQIHTKFVPDAADLPDVDRDYVRRIIERSCARLGVERLDLVQYYWWDDDVPGFERTAVWLEELREEGRIRHVAVTNLDVAHLRRLHEAGVRPLTNQVQYSLLDRRPAGGLEALCATSPLRLLAFGTLAGGFLADRWLGVPDPATFANRSLVKYRLMIDEFGGWDAYQALLRTLAGVAERHGVTIAAAAVRWVLDRPGVAAVVAGATRPGQMRRTIESFGVRLDDEDRALIEAHLRRAPGPSGDVFELERDRSGPHGRIMKYDLNRA